MCSLVNDMELLLVIAFFVFLPQYAMVPPPHSLLIAVNCTYYRSYYFEIFLPFYKLKAFILFALRPTWSCVLTYYDNFSSYTFNTYHRTTLVYTIIHMYTEIAHFAGEYSQFIKMQDR